MAPPSRRPAAPLSQDLLAEARRYDFFQAVRLIERLFPAEGEKDLRPRPVGGDEEPAREAVRFRAAQSSSFAPSAISDLRVKPVKDRRARPRPHLEMLVSFLGLTGPSGVLPHHYTRLLIDRAREKDFMLQDFLDLFNHRLISLFFRAWEKYRYPPAYERSRIARPKGEDPFTGGLYALAGLGTGGLRGVLDVADQSFLYYGGLLAGSRRPALTLGRLLSDYLSLPVSVIQFQGRWLSISKEDRTVVSTSAARAANHCLGRTAVLGEEFWDVRSKFRLRVGPLSLAEYSSFLPSGDAFRPLCQLARFYAGAELDFDVQLTLKAAETPELRLGSSGEIEPRLGWNTWLVSVPRAEGVREALFEAKET
jgi:type VI secretion system protein ImpH